MDYSISQRCNECHKPTRRLALVYGVTNPIVQVIGWSCKKCKIIFINPDFDYKKIISKNLYDGYNAKEKLIIEKKDLGIELE